MIGKKGKDIISIPIPLIDIPHFKYGHKEQGGVGQGEGEVGQQLGPGAVQPGDGHKAGQGEGEHALEVDVSPRELARSSARSCSCRNIEPRARSRSSRSKIKYTGHQHHRPRVAAPLQAHLQAGAAAADRARAPTTRRRRSSSPPARTSATAPGTAAEPAGDQRGHHLHDGRVRLDGRRAEGDRPHRELLDRYLAAAPVQGAGVPLHHPRRGGPRGGPGDLLPHPRVRRHDDQLGLQALPGHHPSRLPARRAGTSTPSTSPTATTGAPTTPRQCIEMLQDRHPARR